MQKIDKKLLNFVTLAQKECIMEGIVYYNNKDLIHKFFIKNNIKIVQHFPMLNAYAVCFNSLNILNTAKQKFVTYISSVASVSAMVDVSKKILRTNNTTLSGKNISIAIIDTGINNHLDFYLGRKKIIKFCDFVNDLKHNYDDNGHGTFVAGVVAGSGILSNGKYAGIANNADIISLKALNEKGEATAITILQAMQWVFDNYEKYNIRVVCMSFGSEPLGYSDPIMKGAEKLWDEGIVVVCAGGNSGPEWQTIKSPGISKKIITVGGLDDKRNYEGLYFEKEFDVAEFSSRGPAFGKIKPDVIAPSVNITSCSHMGGYRQMSGTSVATPMVAGLCALILEKYPKATPLQLKIFTL